MKINKKKIILIFLIFFVIIAIFCLAFISNKKIYVSYKDFNDELENNNIKQVSINDDRIVFKKNNSDDEFFTDNPNYNDFKKDLLLKGIPVENESAKESMNIILDIIMIVIIFGILYIFIQKYYEFNQKNFKIIKHTNVKFEDIAGMDDLKSEISHVVDVLKNPNEYKNRGIRQVKGIILEGPPGNGKTLLAKAIAEEMNVNFIASKGADFQSPVMSLGAQKIKNLFKKAKKHKPCIIFIDEFDSIGEKRNYSGTGVDKENNRIITAMLNEMDGFEPNNGILVIGATNSYASLDAALIRPGRFDLKFNIPNPDQKTRIELINLYTKNKKLSEKINKEILAKSFENLSCSGIETLLNEAALEANMQKNESISIENIINASKKTNCRINLRIL